QVTQPEVPTDPSFVRIMSLHKSKGLTAKVVIVAGVIEGLVPFLDREDPIAEQQRQLEEQRRLFYVAITRCTDRLVLSSVSQLPSNHARTWRLPGQTRGRVVRTQASRFIGELGPTAPRAVSGTAWAAGEYR